MERSRNTHWKIRLQNQKTKQQQINCCKWSKIRDNGTSTDSDWGEPHKKYLLFRLVPELRSTGILGTDMIERLGLKLDFEKKNWWLPEKPQIKYKIETDPKENEVRENEKENRGEQKKTSNL